MRSKSNRNEGSPTMRMWGALHKHFRTEAGKSHDEVGDAVGYSGSLVISIERGIRTPSDMLVETTDAFLDARGALVKAAEHLSRESTSDDLDQVTEELRAKNMCVYDTYVLHALLRSAEYSRRLWLATRPILADEDIDQILALEEERKSRLAASTECGYSFIVEESILRQHMGGPDVKKAQLGRLVELADLRHVTLQVMPTGDTHVGTQGPLTLCQTPENVWQGHLQAHGTFFVATEQNYVNGLVDRYTHLRSLALSPAESAEFVQTLAERI